MHRTPCAAYAQRLRLPAGQCGSMACPAPDQRCLCGPPWQPVTRGQPLPADEKALADAATTIKAADGVTMEPGVKKALANTLCMPSGRSCELKLLPLPDALSSSRHRAGHHMLRCWSRLPTGMTPPHCGHRKLEPSCIAAAVSSCRPVSCRAKPRGGVGRLTPLSSPRETVPPAGPVAQHSTSAWHSARRPVLGPTSRMGGWACQGGSSSPCPVCWPNDEGAGACWRWRCC